MEYGPVRDIELEHIMNNKTTVVIHCIKNGERLLESSIDFNMENKVE